MNILNEYITQLERKEIQNKPEQDVILLKFEDKEIQLEKLKIFNLNE